MLKVNQFQHITHCDGKNATLALEKWFDGAAQTIDNPPVVGENLCEHMASAALAVFLANADLYEFLAQEGMLSEDDT